VSSVFGPTLLRPRIDDPRKALLELKLSQFTVKQLILSYLTNNASNQQAPDNRSSLNAGSGRGPCEGEVGNEIQQRFLEDQLEDLVAKKEYHAQRYVQSLRLTAHGREGAECGQSGDQEVQGAVRQVSEVGGVELDTVKDVGTRELEDADAPTNTNGSAEISSLEKGDMGQVSSSSDIRQVKNGPLDIGSVSSDQLVNSNPHDKNNVVDMEERTLTNNMQILTKTEGSNPSEDRTKSTGTDGVVDDSSGELLGHRASITDARNNSAPHGALGQSDLPARMTIDSSAYTDLTETDMSTSTVTRSYSRSSESVSVAPTRPRSYIPAPSARRSSTSVLSPSPSTSLSSGVDTSSARLMSGSEIVTRRIRDIENRGRASFSGGK